MMNQNDVFVTLINDADQAKIASLVNQLIEQSKSAGMAIKKENRRLQEEYIIVKKPPPTIMPIKNFSDITDFEENTYWPQWYSRNCIILGRLNCTDIDSDIELFFLGDCHPNRADGDYDGFCQLILAEYDWALFSYFTSYRGGYISFITKNKSLHVFVNEKINPALDISERYEQAKCSDFHSATFYDYNGQWLAPILMAEKFNEPPPLLLCSMAQDDPSEISEEDDYDNKEYILYRRTWYQEYIKRLLLVETFEHADQTYQLFSVCDWDAYNRIWSRLGFDPGIADATFSADCDIALLKNKIQQFGYYGIPIKELKTLVSWVYQPCYGGGADEHHGYFYAKNALQTQMVWDYLALEKRNELTARLHSAFFYNDEDIEYWQLPFLLTEAPNCPSPLLLCKIDLKESYQKWSKETWEYLENTVWYEEYLEQFPLVEAFRDERFVYKIHQITDMDAYKAIWSEEMGMTILCAVFSADCDLNLLKQKVLQAEYFSTIDGLENLADWVYTRRNSYVDFYTKNQQYAQKFYELLDMLNKPTDTTHISRF